MLLEYFCHPVDHLGEGLILADCWRQIFFFIFLRKAVVAGLTGLMYIIGLNLELPYTVTLLLGLPFEFNFTVLHYLLTKSLLVVDCLGQDAALNRDLGLPPRDLLSSEAGHVD